MKTTPYALLVALCLAIAPLAQAQDDAAKEPIAETAEAIQAEAAAEGEAGEDGEAAEEPEPEPTPEPSRSFPCRVDAEGERCEVEILEEGEEVSAVEGTVAYQEGHTGKWVVFGSGSFNMEDQPHGCDWVLTYRDRLVEESGCFENGKRHGEWNTCRLSLDPKRPPPTKCPKTEYEMGVIVVKAPEPEPEEAEAEEDRQEGEKPDTDKSDGEEQESEEKKEG